MAAQTYLEQNGGAGLQHLALKTDDVFATLREMRARTDQGGFDFMPRASPDYYRRAGTRGLSATCCVARVSILQSMSRQRQLPRGWQLCRLRVRCWPLCL